MKEAYVLQCILWIENSISVCLIQTDEKINKVPSFEYLGFSLFSLIADS